jgi:hypothetical protein
MNNKEKTEKTKMPEIDMEKQIMGRIKKEHIKMKSHWAFVVEKIGFGSVLALLVLGGALAVAIILYILKKLGSLGFLKLGLPGAKVFLLSVPYDYLILLLVTIILGSFIIRKLNFSLGIKSYLSVPTVALLIVTIFLGAFFAVMGGEEFLKDYYAGRRLPREIAISGKIVEASDSKVLLERNDGSREIVLFNQDQMFPYLPKYAVGKNMQVVGFQDSQDPNFFHAQAISCCEGD